MQTNNIVLRNPNLDPLSDRQLRQFAPAIFAKEPHESVSARYGFFPTYSVVEALHKEGFMPVEVRNYRRRDPSRLSHTKHMIRFRKTGAVNKLVVNDVVPQLVMINAHDRSSPYHFFGGLFRLVCSNGLLVSEGGSVMPVKLRHTINLVDQVGDITAKLIAQHKAVFEYVNLMRRLKLTDKQAAAFARGAWALRPERAGVIDTSDLLVPRRSEDKPRDLWHVLNVVQENMLKGGLHGKTASGRTMQTFGINGINGDIDVNAGIWELAMRVINKAQGKREPVIIEA